MEYWSIIDKVIRKRNLKPEPDTSVQVTSLMMERLTKEYNENKNRVGVFMEFDAIQQNIEIEKVGKKWRIHHRAYRDNTYDHDVESELLDSLRNSVR